MNLYTASNIYSGEIIGSILSFFIITIIDFILPFLSLYILWKTKKQLKDKKLKSMIGDIYKTTKINNCC